MAAQDPYAPPPPAGAPGPQGVVRAPTVSDAHSLGYGAAHGLPPDPPRRPSAALPVAIASILAGVALVLGYYAYQLWQGQREAEVEVARLQKTNDDTKEHVVVLEQEKRKDERALTEAQKEARDMSAQLAAVQSKLDELEDQRAETEARLKEFRKFTQAFQRMIDSGRLEVSFRRGRMIVELPAQVLFPSGSADLTEEGKQSLAEVAKVLRKIRGKRFIVGGHTDNVPVSTREFPSNWALSAGRAVTVTHALIRAGLAQRRLVVAGYGPHDPVASNRSSRGRQRNRRIEIILEPQLREIRGLD